MFASEPYLKQVEIIDIHNHGIIFNACVLVFLKDKFYNF